MAYLFGPYRIDEFDLVWAEDRKSVGLAPKELVLMGVFAEEGYLRPGKAVSTNRLLDAVWPDGAFPDNAEKTLNTHISNLRKKVGERILPPYERKLACAVAIDSPEAFTIRFLGANIDICKDNPYAAFRDHDDILKQLRNTGSLNKLSAAQAGIALCFSLTTGYELDLLIGEFGQIYPQEVGRILKLAASSRDAQVRRHVYHALTLFMVDDRAQLLRAAAIADSDDFGREAAAQSLAILREQDAWEPLFAQIFNPKSQALALAALGDLYEHLQQPDIAKFTESFRRMPWLLRTRMRIALMQRRIRRLSCLPQMWLTAIGCAAISAIAIRPLLAFYGLTIFQISPGRIGGVEGFVNSLLLTACWGIPVTTSLLLVWGTGGRTPQWKWGLGIWAGAAAGLFGGLLTILPQVATYVATVTDVGRFLHATKVSNIGPLMWRPGFACLPIFGFVAGIGSGLALGRILESSGPPLNLPIKDSEYNRESDLTQPQLQSSVLRKGWKTAITSFYTLVPTIGVGAVAAKYVFSSDHSSLSSNSLLGEAFSFYITATALIFGLFLQLKTAALVSADPQPEAYAPALIHPKV